MATQLSLSHLLLRSASSWDLLRPKSSNHCQQSDTILKKTAKRTIVRKAKRKLRSNFIDTVASDSSILDCGHCDDGYLSD